MCPAFHSSKCPHSTHANTHPFCAPPLPLQCLIVGTAHPPFGPRNEFGYVRKCTFVWRCCDGLDKLIGRQPMRFTVMVSSYLSPWLVRWGARCLWQGLQCSVVAASLSYADSRRVTSSWHAISSPLHPSSGTSSGVSWLGFVPNTCQLSASFLS